MVAKLASAVCSAVKIIPVSERRQFAADTFNPVDFGDGLSQEQPLFILFQQTCVRRALGFKSILHQQTISETVNRRNKGLIQTQGVLQPIPSHQLGSNTIPQFAGSRLGKCHGGNAFRAYLARNHPFCKLFFNPEGFTGTRTGGNHNEFWQLAHDGSSPVCMNKRSNGLLSSA